MKFFFDANFPRGIARAVSEVTAAKRDIDIELHDDVFDPGTKDQVWLSQLGRLKEKPIVIGGDGAILRRKAEAEALRESGLTYFLLAKGFTNLNVYAQASLFFKYWPRILEVAKSERSPCIYEIAINGKIKKRCETRQL